MGINLSGQDDNNPNQTADLQEVVYMKNGSIIRGKIISMDKEGDITIKIVGGTVLVFPSSEVDNIKFESGSPYFNNRAYKRIPRPYNVPEPGNYQVAVMGWVVGQGQWGFRPGFSAHYVYGRYINQNLALGLGIGFDVYDLIDNGDGAAQFYLDARGYFKNTSQTFFYKVGLGYGDVFTNRWQVTETTGGLYANPAIGLRFASRSRTHFIMELGATFQKANYVESVWDPIDGTNTQRSEIDIWFQRNTLKLGILFSQNNKKVPQSLD